MIRGAPPAGAAAGSSPGATDERLSTGRPAPSAPPAAPRRRPDGADPRDPRRGAPRPGPGAPGSLAQAVSPTLVTVRAAGRRGAGFIVDPNGYVVTSQRLVAGRGTVEVTLHDGRTLPVSVVSRDPAAGVAVLKLDAAGLPAARLGTSSGLRVGDPVLALGARHPSGPAVTAGTLRGTGVANGGTLALDVPLTPGGGGGPLLNTRGEVIGVASDARTQGAPATAVPIDRIKPILRELQTTRQAAGRPAVLAAPRPSDR
jgi:S1-C subfamily serine protease